MGIQYSHLDLDERAIMASLLQAGKSKADVARQLGRHRSTVSRECARAAHVRLPDCYIPHLGQLAYERGRKRAGRRRRKFGTDLSTPIWQRVIDDLRAGLSPEQSAGRMRYWDSLIAPALPRSPLYASHQSVYCAIRALPHGPQRGELTRLLRLSRGGRRRRRRATSRHTGLRNTMPLALRPVEAASRQVIGHWEGDLIKGAGNRSAIGTLVERASRLVLLVPLRSACAQDVFEGFRRALARLPAQARKSLSYDRGSEMALHEQLSKSLDMPIFFCPPYSPGARGTNENTNGLLRQYLPKGSDLSSLSAGEIAAIQDKLNYRPRHILGFRTPVEAFEKLLHQATCASP